MRKIFCLIYVLCLPALLWSQTYTSNHIGFIKSSPPAGGEVQVRIIGGGIANSPWVAFEGEDKVMSGFRNNIVYAKQTFSEPLFVSKGYYGSFVELKWTVSSNSDAISSFRVYRKVYLSSEDSILVATVPATDRSWHDEYAEAGTIYEYFVYAEGLFEGLLSEGINYISGIGFRVPTATVSGRITYEGGTAVPNVKVIAETEDAFSASSVYLNGTDAYIGLPGNENDYIYQFDTAFTFQAWIKPETSDSATIFEKGNQYKIIYQAGRIDFYAGSTLISVMYTHKIDTFMHIAATYSNNMARLFVLYNDREYWMAEQAVPVVPVSNTRPVLIGCDSVGNYFAGNIDELRLYRKSVDSAFVHSFFGRYISGTEHGLVTYMRLNEAKGRLIFDLSRKGYDFNENHGRIVNCEWSTEVPTQDQLSFKGITDQSGNYLISGLPYGTDGTVYNIVPVLNSHEFNPNQNVLFVGSSSTTHNNINFADISSFKIRGNVVYNNTYFPVQDVNFYVDGQILTKADGTPIASDGFGNYEIDVPIGYHYIEARKYGHVFVDGGRFPTGKGLHDFQEPINGLNFTDSTLLKLAGRVTGGPVQAGKPIGLGRTKNNIGNATITLTTQKGHDLTQTGINGTWANTYNKGSETDTSGFTNYEIAALNPRNVTINPDPVTGEYVAYLLPEKYTVTGISAGNYTFPESANVTIDLSNKFISNLETDTVVIDQAIDQNGDTVNVLRTDSVRYNHNQDFIYRVTPTIDVTHRSGENRFWESEITAGNGVTVPVIDADGLPITPYPIFKQRSLYQLTISVFEQYVNADNADSTDIVPVTDGRVEIQNELAINSDRTVYEINSNGQVFYNFKAGLPNITTGGLGDYVKSFNITAKTGQNGSISTAWLPNAGSSFLGYVFGGMPTGSNFVTKGPDDVSMILRDPPGSNSYAYFESGNSISKTKTVSVGNSFTETTNLNVDLGAKITTFVGLGAGVITENEVFNEVDLGIEFQQSYVDANTISQTITANQTWQTSDDINYVGSMGDLFIGNSTNIVYGISTQIQLLPVNMGTGHVGSTISYDGETYDIGIRKSIRVSPEFSTGFIYSQFFIKNQLITNLKMLRNSFLLNYPDVYQCVNCNQGSSGFGEPNTTGAYDSTGYSGGDSYNIKIPADWPEGVIFEDSVELYNQQIASWEYWLEVNEQEKVQAELERNISFDAGTVYENTVTNENSEEKTFEFEFSVSPSFSQEIGFEVLGCGSKFKYEFNYNNTSTGSEGETTTSSTTFGYVLADGDAADYMSIDVKKPKAQTGTVFLTKGGQTMCPYQGGDFTEYYLPGTPLNQATMEREVPVISCENPLQINVPEDAAAVYNVQLSNAAPTGDPQWFMVSVDEQSNQNGAMIKMDGASILNGRTIMVPNGTTLNKTITIEKVQPDVYDYEDIGIILHSICQFSAGVDLYADISDTVKLTANFQQVCSGITLENPKDQWIINTNSDTALQINIRNYNLEHSSLDRILFQYKAASTPTWTTEMVYYMNQADYDAASDPKELIDSRPELSYTFALNDMQDRNYDIKAQTVCADGTYNESVIASGIKDVKRPQLFGTPQPGDGILNPGEDVMITFDEPIQAGVLTPYNFSVRGVLNGTELQHSAGLYFDGIDDYATVQKGPVLKDNSFTISFWTKRGDLTEGAVFSQNELEIGFASNNKIYVKAGNQAFYSQSTYSTTDAWHHVALAFNNETNMFALYVNDIIEVEDVALAQAYNPDGKINLGRDAAGTSYFNGYLHELRIWDDALGFGKVYAMMYQRLSGNEIGLTACWPMSEARGSMAQEVARSAHALLFGASWAVFPSGYAGVFNGTDQVMKIPTLSSVLLTKNMDLTIEFFFKAAPQSNTVIFSNGNDAGTDVLPAYQDIWVIGFDANGKMYAKNSGSLITLTDSEVTDNTWHHFAMVVNRLGNTSIYIDNELKQYKQSDLFGGLMGVDMAIGARRNQPSSDTNSIFYDKHFEGAIDEFRIWNLARTVKQLSLDMNSKLQGDEMGLLAYYPFEEFNGVGSLEESALEYTDTVYATTGNTFTNIDVPNIKGARPVQDVAFDWVVNEDKIIININEQPATIEKCILEFTVERAEDLRENRMASPLTWTAYVKQNTVIWDVDQLSFEKNLYDTLSFKVTIKNTGGTEQGYEITNLPAWLTCSEAEGILGPDSYKNIQFTVNEAIYIGNYLVSLYLTSDFGYSEKLDLNLKVSKPAPKWEVDPSRYQYSSNVIGQLLIDSLVSTDTEDIIAAFVGEECRGVTTMQYVPEYDAYLAFLDVYSNIEYGEAITYKVWDASAGLVITEVTPTLIFEANTVIGHPWAPQQWNAVSYFETSIALNKGWNWVSFNLNSPHLNDMSILLKDVQLADNTIIKGQLAYDIYSSQTGTWFGNLSSQGGINTTSMYMLKSSITDTIVYEGAKAFTNNAISIHQGWNWLGFTPQVSLNVEEAFASMQPARGDLIKNQTQFAMYDPNLGWIGSLTTMQPGKGYMYYADTSAALYYPEFSQLSLKSAVINLPADLVPWQDKSLNYSFNQTIVARVYSAVSLPNTLTVAAFVNDECRGYGKIKEIDGTNYYFINVSGETEGEKIHFRAYDAKNEMYYISSNQINYQSNEMLGSLYSPFVINFEADATNVNEFAIPEISVYPNPARDAITIMLGKETTLANDILVLNQLGKKVHTIKREEISGQHVITWDFVSNAGTKLPFGVYFFHITTQNGIKTMVVIKQ